MALCWIAAMAALAAAQDAPKTGSVSGKVVDVQSGDPVARVVVTLQNGRETAVGTKTDEHGKFSIVDLEPGTYAVGANRTGYILSSATPRQIEVKAGDTAGDVAIKMSRTGVIAGRVLDADGEPVANAGVQVLKARVKPGESRVSYFSQTDDRGQFRAFFVPPGEYKVAVMDSNRGYPPVRLQGGKGEAYPPAYYPGTTDESQAAVVRVQPGAELGGVDIMLVRARGVNVRGRIGSAQVGFPAAFISMVPAVKGARGVPSRTYDAIVDMTKGEFEMKDVLPGRYRVTARVVDVGDGRQSMVGKTTVAVGDADVDGLQLVASPARKIAGRFLLPEGRKLPGGLMVALVPRDGDTDAGGFGPVATDATFTLSEVAPGEYDVFIGSTRPDVQDDLYISAIRAGDDDALADGLRVGAATASSLEIALKPNGGAVELSVSDEKSAPVSGVNVLLWPDPPRERQIALSGNCKTDAKGTCTISGITPGAYHCYALAERMSEVDLREPDALQPYEKFGKAVKVGEGDKTSLALTIVSTE